MKVQRILIMMALGFCTSGLCGQNISVQFLDTDNKSITEQTVARSWEDSLARFNFLKNWLSDHHEKGWLESAIDSVRSSKTGHIVYYRQGPRYKWRSVYVSELGQFDPKLESRYQRLEGEFYDHNQLVKVNNRWLNEAQKNGHPFASISIDSMAMEGEYVSQWISGELYEKIFLDSFRIEGDVRLSRQFISSYLNVKMGDVYDEDVIRKMDSRLAELPFLEVGKPSVVSFYNEKASTYLYLKNRAVSRFHFLVGLQPNSGEDRRFVLTGDALLHLVNPFGGGRELSLSWRQLQPRTQRLELFGNYPFVGGLPIGVNGDFNLYKRDTLYLQLERGLGLHYQYLGNNYFSASFHVHSTNILSIDTNQIKLTQTLPENIDVSTAFYNLAWSHAQYDYKLNPRNGYFVNVAVGIGDKKVKKRDQIANLADESSGQTFEYLYDSLKLRSLQWKLGMELGKYWKLGSRTTVLTSVDAAALVGKDLFQNEFFRIGGSQRLRGFDEESIFSPYYIKATVELRYLLGRNSYAYTFFDQGLIEQSALPANRDWPFGFGVGAAMETKAGIFALSYALGRQQNNPIQFRLGKIHFGYVNYF